MKQQTTFTLETNIADLKKIVANLESAVKAFENFKVKFEVKSSTLNLEANTISK